MLTLTAQICSSLSSVCCCQVPFLQHVAKLLHGVVQCGYLCVRWERAVCSVLCHSLSVWQWLS